MPLPLRDEAGRVAEQVARQSYGRLVAYLGRAWRDIAAVEDAIGEALARALERWPETGIPDNPDAWLLVAARNRLIDGARSNTSRTEALDTVLVTMPSGDEEAPMLPDRRLELLFVCAHPAIDRAMHTPLMLQTVLGLSAERIASSFLVSPDTMGRRLSRTKLRIRDIGLGFELPDGDALPARMESVLEAIYAAYGQGWDSVASDDASRVGLGEEAIWLSRVLVAVAPASAEARGLLALLLFCDARGAARRVDGRYVPFGAQEVTRWDRRLLATAETELGAAARLGAPGRFQLEAAIQSAMVQGRLRDTDMRQPLLRLHDALVAYAPTIGNLVGRAAALADAEGPVAGLAALDLLPEERTRSYQPYWALKAHLFARSSADPAAIAAAFSRATGLSEDASVRAYLAAELARYRDARPEA